MLLMFLLMFVQDLPQMVFITTRPCVLCVIAKTQFELVRSEGAFKDFEVVTLDAVNDRGSLITLGLPLSAPQVVMVQDNHVVAKVDGVITREKLRQLAKLKPVECFEPVVLNDDDLLASEGLFANSEVVVTWDLATQYKSGSYNGTFAWGRIEHGLNASSRYWNVRYKRVTRGGMMHVIQSSSDLGKDVAARSGGDTIRISPTFRFVSPIQCEMVILHECRHFRSQAHTAQTGGLMGPSGGYLLLDADVRYFDRMTWKSALRPSQEPNWLKEYFTGTYGYANTEEIQFPLLNQQR